MARQWTAQEELDQKALLTQLYIRENLSIKEIGSILSISEKTVYARLVRLGISTNPQEKLGYLNSKPFAVPERSEALAELFGILLGDGHLSLYQTAVTLGSKEEEYVLYVRNILTSVFRLPASIHTSPLGHSTVYVSSVRLSHWLYSEGLVSNKVERQVSVPSWIADSEVYMTSFIRGFFDTDGSVYALRHGVQISLTNKSVPLLNALQNMLRTLGYRVSEISAYRLYITRKEDVERFFLNVMPKNHKHLSRYQHIMRR